MNISLYKASINDKALLDNLLQLYIHDISEFIPFEVGPSGKYENNISAQYVSSFERSAYIIHAEYHIIGFALIEPTNDYIYVNDLFVLNMWRGKGVGSAVVDIISKEGKPLNAKFDSKNQLARFFWENISKNSSHKIEFKEKNGNVNVIVEY